MATSIDSARFPEARVSIERRSDGAIVVRVKSDGQGEAQLPDAVFAFRCGDPQYAYWLERLNAASNIRQ